VKSGEEPVESCAVILNDTDGSGERGFTTGIEVGEESIMW
jgi:hypothetical protein